MDPTWGDEFEAMLPEIEAAITEAAFVAIDCEFTGLKDLKSQLPKPQGRKQTVEERYQDVISHKNAGFALIQLGICPVAWDTDAGHYIAKPFNFFVSPVMDPMFSLDRTFLCQSSALEMLCRGGMDFNHLIRHGIRYLSQDEEREIRAKEIDRADGVREEIVVDEGGARFLKSVECEIRPWLEDTSEDKYDFCNITVTSSYYKRILHQSMSTMFPNLLIRSSKRHFIQIVENKETTQNAIKNARKDKFTNRIEEAVGLRKVLDLIIKNHKILVGHNVFQDLVFIWSQFIGKLPDTVERFSQDVLRCFPTVYDTKYISAVHPLCKDVKIPDLLSICPLPPTSLEYLALWARESNQDQQLKLSLHHKHLRYGVHEQQHEAGYDAFLTAQVLLSLSAEMSAVEKIPKGGLDLINSGAKKRGLMDSGEWNRESAFKSFVGGIFEGWEGFLSVNGTIEGFIKLRNTKKKALSQ